MRQTVIIKTFKLLLLVSVLISPAAWAADPSEKARRPPPKPDPRARAIPELVCTGDRAVTITNESLESKSEESPLRLRLDGNLLYIGETTVSEKFFGLINQSDRRRWTVGTATLILDEDLQQGVWVRLTLGTTRVRAVHCEPFGTTPR